MVIYLIKYVNQVLVLHIRIQTAGSKLPEAKE